MFKINETKIVYHGVYSLFLLAVLTLGVMAVPTETNGQVQQYGGASGYGGYINSQAGTNPNPNYYYQPPAPFYVQPQTQVIAYAPTPIIYSNSANPNQVTTVSRTSTTVVKEKAPTEYTLAYVPTSLMKSVGAIKANESDLKLTASVSDAGSFIPSNIIEWILFAILVLLLVITVRKVFGADKKYQETPMKHA